MAGGVRRLMAASPSRSLIQRWIDMPKRNEEARMRRCTCLVSSSPLENRRWIMFPESSPLPFLSFPLSFLSCFEAIPPDHQYSDRDGERNSERGISQTSLSFFCAT